MFGAMSQLTDYQQQVQNLLHDLAGNDFSPSELTGYINNARNRAAMDFHNIRYLLQNASVIANQEQYPIQGGIAGVAITNPGNYPSHVAPTVTFSNPLTGGVLATGTANLANTGVASVFMSNYGTLYVPGVGAPATVSFSAGSPTATGVPLVETNVFDILSITVLWGTTERYMLGWAPFTPFQAYCRANPTVNSRPVAFTTFTEQNLFFLYPTPDQGYLCDIDMLAFPMPLVNASDVDVQMLPPINDAVQYYAAHLGYLKLQQFDQATYYESKYKRRVGELQTTRQDRRIWNPYRTYQRRIARW